MKPDRPDERPAEPEAAGGTEPTPFAIVGVGASAGGLNAFSEFFAGLPANPGMAFVLIQHLAPDYESELARLLQNHTPLRVLQVHDRMRTEAGGVYVIPPGKALSIQNGVLRLAEPARPHGQRAPIDGFFRSLAEDQGERAVCIVLSGTGSDGALGLKTVKEAGGLTMVQTPEDAEYDGMPRNAIGTGLVDIVLPAGELGERLVELRRQGLPPTAESLTEDDSEALTQIFAHLRTSTGHDFSRYKQSTVLRRIGRRMQVTGARDLPAYLDAIEKDPHEAQALLNDLLISVTRFFRDPEAFAVLAREAIPALFAGKGPTDQVRVWVPGCATGEEAYTLAILLCEHASRLEHPPAIQIFATDIDERALAFAREGVYPEGIAADVSPERLERFFEREGENYRVKKGLREIVLFATHNLLKDPPFSKLDLISCRNILIYLQRRTQQRIFEVFAYALREPGYLFLGTSESVEGTKDLYVTADKKQRLFRGRGVMRQGLRFPTLAPLNASAVHAAATGEQREQEAPPASLEALHARLLVQHHAPPSVIVNESHEILHIAGDVSRFLAFAAGRPSHDLLKVARLPLRPELRTALFHAFGQGRTTERLRIRAALNERPTAVLLTVRPLREADGAAGLVQVVFEEEPAPDDAPAAEGEGSPAMEHLEAELQRTKDRLQNTIEEYETSNEELKASNEELLSMNEELQTTSEELETGREELQSINEELSSVNQELKTKIEELARANADLQNLIDSTDVATLFLDRDLRIVRSTPRLADLFNVLPADCGRPIEHLTRKVAYGEFVGDARGVLETLAPLEREVVAEDGRRFLTRIVPYRTADDEIDGIVATFVDITRRVEAEEAAARREARFRRVIAEAPVPVLLHAEDGEVLQISRAVTELTGYAPEEIPTRDAWTQKAYGERAEHVAADIDRLYEGDARVDEGEYRIRTKSGGERVWQFSSSPVGQDAQGRRLVVSMAADVTERKQAEAAREIHADQQAALAAFGLYALTETDLQALFERAVTVVHDTLGTDFSKILELQPDGEALLLRAGIGWKPGLAGTAMVPTDEGSQAGYTLTVDEPVIVDDLATETRFQGPALLTEHGVVSGMSVVIGGLTDPFGVFGTHTRTPRAFTATDARFFQSVANVVASAIDRIEATQRLEGRVEERTEHLRESEARLRLLYDVVSHPAEDFSAQVHRALRLATDLLGLDAGILGHVEGDTYSVAACYAPELPLSSGQSFSVEATPCAITLTTDQPLLVDRLSASEYRDHPCRAVFDIEAYAGAPIRVGGAVYGTLNFTSAAPKSPPFTDGDREVVALLAQWLGAALEREAAETALREEKEWSERIIESSFDGILVFDTDFRYTVWNEGMERITGRRAKEVLGRVSYEVFPFLKTTGAMDFQQAALRGEAVTTKQLPFEVPSTGRSGFFEGRYSPIRDPEGAIVGGLGVIRDVTEQRRVQEEIERSEQILAGVLLGSLDGITALEAIRDEAGEIVDFVFLIVNPAAAEVYGRRAEDLLGKRYLAHLPGTRDTGIFDAFVRVVEMGEPYRTELYYDADGITGWFDFTAVKLGDGVAQTFRNVTEQREAERALRESEARFRELFESSPDAIFVEDLDGVVLDVNPAACRLHNAGRDWLVGRNLSELVPPEYRGQARKDFERLAAGEVGLLESHSYTADGLVIPVEVRTDRITYGGQDAVLLHVRDVTEREAAEHALRESEERFAKAFHAAPVAMTIATSNENRYLDVNESFCTLTGFTRNELIGHTASELGLLPEGPPDGLGTEQIEGVEQVQALEVTLRTKSGDRRDILVSAEFIEIGGLRCTLGIGFDVTDRKRLEREVIEASELERRRIGQDLHDGLGQQLTGAAFLGHVLSQKLATAGHAEAEAARQLTALINEVLAETRDFSRLLSPVDVFADGLVDALQDLVDQTERIFEVACTLDPEGDVRVSDNVVATHLYRIAQEALTNAVKHADPTTVRVVLTQEAVGLRLRVEDDGIGIAPAAIEHPAGIGLRTMRYRAALIGGTLRVGRTPTGSAVSVLVPNEAPDT